MRRIGEYRDEALWQSGKSQCLLLAQATCNI